MAVPSGGIYPTQSTIPATELRINVGLWYRRRPSGINISSIGNRNSSRTWMRVLALERNNNSSSDAAVPNSNYVVPLDSKSSSCITRPLAEILRDLNKRIPDNIIIKAEGVDHDHQHYPTTFIPWYHANRMLSFYAPGWCGEIRDVIFSDNGNVTVVYRVIVRGSDGEENGNQDSLEVRFLLSLLEIWNELNATLSGKTVISALVVDQIGVLALGHFYGAF